MARPAGCLDAAVRDLKIQNTVLRRGRTRRILTFFRMTAAKILLQIGAAGAAYLRENGFEPEMVCGPNVLAMTSPCDAEDALDRLADVLARLGQNGGAARGPATYPARARRGALHDRRGTAAPVRAVWMRDAVGKTAASISGPIPPAYRWSHRARTAALAAACRALEQAGTALKHTGGSGAEEIAVL